MKRVVVFVTWITALGAALGGATEAGCQKAPDPTRTATTSSGSASPGGAAATPSNTNSVTADPLPRPLFWSVEKDGKTTYFLGTMHVGIDAETRLPATVWTKLHAATTFAMEADLDDAAVAALLEPTASSLRVELGDDYWKKLEDAMGPSVARTLDHMPPMIPAAALSLRSLPQTLPMDKVLASRAAGEHKQVVFLEPASLQLAILGKWMDVKALKMMLDELPEQDQHARAMIDAYAAGDEDKLVAISDSEKADALHHGYTAAEYDQEMNEMLYNRNASWIDALEKLHAGGAAFVAVGALHLIGPRSVLALLARRGYHVKRIAP
jgi:uncharacterized protein YbaP (TraB family)